MHILVISPYRVGDHSLGGAKRIFRMVRHFATTERVSYACFADNQGRDHGPRLEILDLCPTVIQVPVPRPSKLLKLANYFFSTRPSSTCFHDNPELRRQVATFARRDSIDFIHVEFFDMASAIADIGPNIPRVLVSQEVFSCARRIHRNWLDKLKDVGQRAKLRAYEAAVCRSFQQIYCITPEEVRYLQGRGVKNVGLYPHVVDTREFSLADPVREEEESLLFLGNFDHLPNADALVWFAEAILPVIIQAFPGVILNVVGPNLDLNRLGLKAGRHLRVHGEVDDLQDWFDKAAIFVNPIVSGGGMRGKMLEAMAKGKPIVSTTLGVMGIQVTDGQDVLLAESPEAFAQGVISLLKNEGRRRSLGRKARKTVCHNYDERLIFQRQLDQYRTLRRLS